MAGEGDEKIGGQGQFEFNNLSGKWGMDQALGSQPL